jgi:ABC-2 type transport system permease protein
LVLTWLPAVAAAAGFFLYEQSITQPELRRGLADFTRIVGQDRAIRDLVMEEPEAARHQVWSILLLAFFRYPQALVMALIVGLIAPRLIAYDVRTRAYLLLFSRPIGVNEYVLGKLCVVWFYLAIITTVPALVLYLIGVFLSPDLGVVSQTWDLPLRVLAASVWLIVPTSLVALAFSSLTIDSRYAAFAWFAMWVLGWAAYSILTLVQISVQGGPMRRRRWSADAAHWEFLSPYHILGRVQQWCFGLLPEQQSVGPYLIGLVLVSLLAWMVVRRRMRQVSTA